jgi:hypothetical protein
MSSIPLDLQRKFERRWAARFISPATSATPKSTDLERCRQQLPSPAKGKRKTRRAGPAGQISHIGLSAGPKPRALVTYHLNRLSVRPGAGGCASGPIGAGARANPAPRPTHEKGG